MRIQSSHLIRGVLLAASGLVLGVTGCELVATVDRTELEGNVTPPECATAANCPDPGNECLERACSQGTCKPNPVASGTPIAMQSDGDCKVMVCDGNGATTSQNDDMDVPDDGNECTDNVCTAGTPSNPALASNTACGTDGMLYCDGAGQCVGCTAPEQCGTASDCSTPTCQAGTCGVSFAPAGTGIPKQTTGDCKIVVCDGAGASTSAEDDGDLPVDNNDCTADICTAGAPSNPALVVDTACGAGGTLFCDGAGKCVGCNNASQCGMPTDCAMPVCVASACGTNFVVVGTPVPNQSSGDCQELQCDGLGGTKSVAKNSDLPSDNKQCTEDLCVAGAPMFPNSSSGKVCNEGTGIKCNGGGACVECLVNADCASNVCVAQACAAPTCMDLTKNGAETDTDCGGGTCPACVNGKACTINADCTSMKCMGNLCVP